MIVKDNTDNNKQQPSQSIVKQKNTSIEETLNDSSNNNKNIFNRETRSIFIGIGEKY